MKTLEDLKARIKKGATLTLTRYLVGGLERHHHMLNVRQRIRSYNPISRTLLTESNEQQSGRHIYLWSKQDVTEPTLEPSINFVKDGFEVRNRRFSWLYLVIPIRQDFV